MSYNYTLRYKTFNELLEEVNVDFKTYSTEDFIDPQQLIKVAKRVNYDLGLRIFKTKEIVIEVEKGRAKLPDDFYVLNFALLCGSFEVVQSLPQGTHIEERSLDPVYKCQPSTIDTCTDPQFPNPNSCNGCNVTPCNCHTAQPSFAQQCQPCPRVVLNCKGQSYELIQRINTQTRLFKMLLPIRILSNPQTIDCDCPNLYWESPNTGWIRDNFFYTNFKDGKVYLNYQGMMEDDEGNLLVPDHDLLNEYYEYALKQRILENLIMNDNSSTAIQKLQLIEQRYRAARNTALSLVNTPNWGELKKMWEVNRKAQYHKYYDMFKSYDNYGRTGHGSLNASKPYNSVY